MKAVQIPAPKGDFELVERPIPDVKPGTVRVKIHACGICHSDVFAKDGLFPGTEYPRVPGHEVAGVIDAVADDVTSWKPGDRVGIGWHGSHCFTCDSCRSGDFLLCPKTKTTGLSFDGGYQEYGVFPAESLALIPDELSYVEAAPLMCAGVTVFNCIRNAGLRPGDVVAVQGIGGLGHLAIQYCRRIGMYTVALSGSGSKAELAKKLGAHVYIDSSTQNPVEELQKLGGARMILATAPDSDVISSVAGGLGRNGEVVVVAADGKPMSVPPLLLIGKRGGVRGWPSGTAKDSQDTMLFSARFDVKPMVEVFPLEKAAEAYEVMMQNKARFRVVLEIQ